MPESPGLRPLYLVDELAKAAGEEITYAYDDLAFISHSEVLVQFTDQPDNALHYFVHADLADEAAQALREKYELIAGEKETKLLYKGRFAMKPQEGSEQIDLQFFPEDDST